MDLILFINTGTNEYYIRAKGLMKASLEPHKEELIRIHIQALFMNFYFYPIKKIGASKKQKKTKTKSTKKKGHVSFQKGIRVIRTFKVKRFSVDLDTGDCITNAKLYPVFALLNHHTGNFRLNFEGRNQLLLYMHNRPIHILKSFINF
ncbi:MAG: hypothetical protein WBM98_02810 [Maribacter sp.]|uniref:hypothetical protein n=1 Tax=Maribacter sp. TaxID=1897614 RepID=UPI003C728ABB